MHQPLELSRGQRIARVLWDKGPIALCMAPNGFAIGVWFYFSVLPDSVRTSIPWLDVLAGVTAVLTALAVDIGVVRIATGIPTHKNRWASFTTWVPIIVWLMGCFILWDWYAIPGRSPFSIATHLAFPTIALAIALYWSFEFGYEHDLTSPLLKKIAELEAEQTELLSGFSIAVDRETAELRDQLGAAQHQLNLLTPQLEDRERLLHDRNQLNARLSEAHAHSQNVEQQLSDHSAASQEVERQLERAKLELIEVRQGLTDELTATRQQLIAARDALLAQGIELSTVRDEGENLEHKLIKAHQELNGLRGELSAVRDELNGKEFLLKHSLADLIALKDGQPEQPPELIEPAFQYLTSKEAIESLLDGNPDLTNDELVAQLRVRPDDIKTFRSQVSQARSSLKLRQSTIAQAAIAQNGVSHE